jgi:rod shape-determining protein MreD
MKRVLLFILLGVIVLTLQTTLLGFFPIQRIRPDFMLIFTLFLGFLFPPGPGAILAFFLGYLMDLFSGSTFGFYAFSRPLLFYGAYLFKSKFYLEGFSSQFIFVFLLSSLEGLLLLLFLSFLSPEPLFHLYPSFLFSLLPQSTFTALITPLLFILFQRGSGFLAKKNGVSLQEKG